MKKTSYQQFKIRRALGEMKSGQLHSGSKRGPLVKSRAQAIAIGISESKRPASKR